MPIYGRSGLPDWTQGTATATNNNAIVTFSGAALTSTDPTTGAALWVAGRGDFFGVAGVGAVMIASVDSASQVTLMQPWPFATQTAHAYTIIRMAFPQTGSIAKAIQDLQNSGQFAVPWTVNVIDDGTARIAFEMVAGTPTIAVGPTGTAQASLTPSIQINPTSGAVTFPQGFYTGADWNRNRLINGGFDVAAEGGAFTLASASGRYVLDQWVVNNNSTTQTLTTNRVAALSGFSSQYALQITGALDAGQNVTIMQPLEAQRIADLAGSAVAVSFDINATTTAGTLTGYIVFSCNTAVDNGTYSNNTATLAFTVPTGSGRITLTMPASQTANLKYGARLKIVMTQNGATGTIALSFGGVQAEKGVLANPFSPKPISVEVADCERFFQTSYDLNIKPGTAAATTGYGIVTQATCSYASIQCPFRTRMRADPTLLLYSSNSGTVTKIFNATSATDVGGMVNYANQNGFIAIVYGTSVPANNYLLCAWSANARLA